MKIVVLHGQKHKGSTYNITYLFLNNLIDENTEIKEFFMPEDTPPFCTGCFNCFTKGETECPHAHIVQPIVKEMDEADLLIIDSPCYVFGMSGQLKTLFDHLAYRWLAHRPSPKMFSKVGLVISTAAGAGANKVTKSLQNQLFYFGVAKTFRFSKNVGAMNWESVKQKKKSQIEKNVIKLSNKILKQKYNTKVGLKSKLIFNIMRLNQKANEWNPIDKSHWEQNGWLKKDRPWIN